MSAVIIGINGFSAVGRAVFFASLNDPSVSVGVINDVSYSTEFIAYVLEHERPSYAPKITVELFGTEELLINGTMKVTVTHSHDARSIGWGDRNVAVVIECTGLASTRERCWGHVTGGAAAVIIAAQSADAPVVVPGVNDADIEKGMPVISAGSAIGAVLAPFLQLLDLTVGVEEVSYTVMVGPQSADPAAGRSSDKREWRQTRLSSSAVVPHHNSGSATLKKVLPNLSDKISGSVFQVPTEQQCAIDLYVRSTQVVTKEQLDVTIAEASQDAKFVKSVEVHAKESYLISSDCAGKGKAIYEKAVSTTNHAGVAHKLLLWADLNCFYAHRLLSLVGMAKEVMYNKKTTD